ncbi:unnamed protein product [Allacma fusca]|uniref:CRAL-TRIO domain-containing protein n=1 Tax=Allacma fusca TaxID=39272 RepID=A0A8J2NR78_9HEXA|nr:unnamed protein product [Allacma fusca]
MEASNLVFLVLSVILSLVILETQAQLPEEDVPSGLQHLLKWDLDTWKPPQEIADDFPYYLSGFGEDNRPIWVLEFGKWDIPGMLARGSKWEKILDKHVDQWLWRMWKSLGLKSDPKDPVTEALVIVDMEGYGFKQLNSSEAMAFVVRKMRLVTLTLRFAFEAYAINTNFVGDAFLRILRPILGKDFEKLDIYGTNPAKWRPIVLRHIPRDQIRESYGGKKNFKPFWTSSENSFPETP